MPPKFNNAVYEFVGALDREGVAVKEITRRLNNNEAGFGHKVPISQRSVYDYRAAFRRDNGPPPTGDIQPDQTANSIAALKTRALERIATEIRYVEELPPGKMRGEDVTKLKRAFAALDDMQRREENAEKRKGKRGAAQNGQQPKSLSAIEQLAQRAREQQSAPAP